jgi:hypothetical protein
MAAHTTPERLTAQIACEAIVNHESDGYSLTDMAHVFEVACREGVAALYVDTLRERIEAAVAHLANGGTL